MLFGKIFKPYLIDTAFLLMWFGDCDGVYAEFYSFFVWD